MRSPEFVMCVFSQLEHLSHRASTFSKNYPKLGGLAGLTIVLLKTCAIVPTYITQVIINLGVVLVNCAGAAFSKRCVKDFKASVREFASSVKPASLSPLYTVLQLVKGVFGVLRDPAANRWIDNDTWF